ncbi:MAG: GatB/YqeY domain-containing protein [Bdellovibrionaceae bacterium]|nr:GatB/YqeY domain-containing protein [Pseudobdellovibrionaceae bacterium]
MDIREQIMADIKSAMKDKDNLKVSALRFLQSAIKNREIELRPQPMSEEEAFGVLKRMIKQRKESIEQYKAGGREDLVQQETAELKVLESYLPPQMGPEQVEAIVVEVVAALGAKTIKDMGPVMKEVQARTKGSADNKLISEIVRAKLS